ncbi:MAG: TetR/AcrR family transcriptional regulator [Desulfovibrionaceae bacterium]
MARKQQEKSRQTMADLMAAAEELFSGKGFLATTVAEITQHAGYAKGSFYRHWDSKDALFLEIVEHKLHAYREARDEKIGRARTLREAMLVIWDFLESILSDRNWAKVFLEFTVQAARDAALKKTLTRRQYRLSEALFADLVREFVDSDCPPEKLGALNTVLFEGFMVHNALEVGVLDIADIREAAVALALQLGTKDGVGRVKVL